MTREEIESKMITSIPTETNKRKWERRYIGALTETHRQKCLYFIRLYTV